MPEPLAVASSPLVYQWLSGVPAVVALVGDEIDHRLNGVYPAIRLTDIGPMSRGPEEQLRRIQVECWADDYRTAWTVAATVEANVDSARGDYPAGYCAGGDVVSGPFYSPDPQSRRHRWQLDVALWLYPTG